VDALDLLAAASWGDARPMAPTRRRTSHVRGVRPLDRLADAVGDLASAHPALDLSDGAACVKAAYGAPVGGREDRPPRGLVRRCGARRRAQDAEVLVACWETVERARLLVHADPPRRGHAVACRSTPESGTPARRSGRPEQTAPSWLPASDVLARIARVVLMAAAVAVGLRWALPLQGVQGRCPPAGEGYGYCWVQKSVAPALVLAVVPVLAMHLLLQFALVSAPAALRRWRAGERPTRVTRAQATAPYEDDPVLLAASWGRRTGTPDAS